MEKAIEWEKPKAARNCVIVPTKAIKAIMAAAGENKEHSAVLKFYDNYTFCCEVGRIELYGKLIDGTYPNWERVIPKCPAEQKALFNPEEIKKVMPELKIFKAISSGRGKPYVRIGEGHIEAITPGGKTLKIWPSCTKFPARSFNAVYLSELCGGQVSYANIVDPVLIEERRGPVRKFCVVMPLRI